MEWVGDIFHIGDSCTEFSWGEPEIVRARCPEYLVVCKARHLRGKNSRLRLRQSCQRTQLVHDSVCGGTSKFAGILGVARRPQCEPLNPQGILPYKGPFDLLSHCSACHNEVTTELNLESESR